MLVLIVGLILFLGIHSVRIVAPDWVSRERVAMGEGLWKGIYSLVSAVGFALIVWGFSRARGLGIVLYEPPAWLKEVAAFAMLFSFISLGVYLVPAGRLKPMLKHPMLLAIKIWAVAHLIANGDIGSLVLFLSLLAWAVADRISVKRRAVPVPLSGPGYYDAAAVALGFVLYALFVWRLHYWLIGVQPGG